MGKLVTVKLWTGLPNNPINHEQCSRSSRHLFAPVHTSPSVHGDQTSHYREVSQVKDSGIPNIRQTAEVLVPEWPTHGFVQVLDTVRFQDLVLRSKFAKFPPEIFALLRGDLRRLEIMVSAHEANGVNEARLTAGNAVILFPISSRSLHSSFNVKLLSASESYKSNSIRTFIALLSKGTDHTFNADLFHVGLRHGDTLFNPGDCHTMRTRTSRDWPRSLPMKSNSSKSIFPFLSLSASSTSSRRWLTRDVSIYFTDLVDLQ